MAIAKLGGIVTDMRGSIGGTTFRKIKGTTQVYNKSSGAAKSSIKLTDGFLFLQNINKGWVALTDAERDQWNLEGQRFFRVNRFGDSIAYTGRQLYTAVRYNNYWTGLNVTDPTTIIGSVAIPEFAVDINESAPQAQLVVTTFYENTYVLAQGKILKDASSNYSPQRSKIRGSWFINGAGTYVLNGFSGAVSGLIKQDQILGVSLMFVNETAWRSPQVIRKVKVGA